MTSLPSESAPDRCKCCSTLAIVVYAVLVAARIPDILLKGRFWAEDAAVYFAAARQTRWHDALFLVHAGYLNLVASVVTLAATAVPLEDAPWVSSLLALLVQLLAPVLLLTSRLAWVRRGWQMAAALLLLLVVQDTGEVWLNAITSQFHLGLCTALVLAMPIRGGWIGALRAAILVVGGLSGPASALLTPLFLLRAWLDRSRVRLAQAALLVAMSAIQLAMLLQHPVAARAFEIRPRLLALMIFSKNILLPALGPSRAEAISSRILAQVEAGGTPLVAFVLTVLAAAMLAWGAIASRDAAVRWLLLAAAVTMPVFYLGALGPIKLMVVASYGSRYALIPSSLISLAVFGTSQTIAGFCRLPFALASAWIAVAGIIAYPRVDPLFAHGPAWPGEVAKLRADPTYMPQPWPDFPAWKWPLGPAE